MSEIKDPIGQWEDIKTSSGHGVYEKAGASSRSTTRVPSNTGKKDRLVAAR